MKLRRHSIDSVLTPAVDSCSARVMLFKSVVAAVTLCGVSPSLHGQVFRSGADLRVLDIVVTGNDGRPVNGLGVNDFEVMEDGERRIVKFVTPIAVPEASRVIDRRPASSGDVWTNESTASRRIFAIVIDDLSTRASDTARARSIVRRFIERVPDGDLVSVVFTGQQTGAQEFTSDKARLRRTVDQFVGRNAIPDLDSVTSDDPTSMAVMQRGGALNETRPNVQRMMQTVINVTDWLSSVEDRRKAILFVTAGLPVALTQAILAGADSPDLRGGAGTSALFARLLARASLANIALYPLDYQGLATPLNRELTQSSFGDISPLAVLADQTGGVAAVHANDVDRLFDTMIQDSSAYYLIGYEPAVEERDEKRARRHRIVVRSRVKGTTVRNRHSYITAPTRRGPRESTAADLLSSPLPGGSLGLRVQATAFPSGRNQGRVIVVLEVSGQDLAVVPDRVQQTVALTYRLVATDVNGKVRAAQAETVTLRLSDDRLQQIADAGVRVLGQLDLPPGSYRLRASVVNQASHGVAAGDVDVPDYRKRRAGVSGVLLASRDSAKAPVRREDYAPFKGRLPAVPTTQRSFALEEQIEAYLEVDAEDQRPQVERATEVPTVTATIETKSGQMVAAIPVTVGARARGIGGGQAYRVHATVKTAGLPAGDYVLRFSASIEPATMLSQLVAFSVR